MELDEFLTKHVGEFGLYQAFLVFLLCAPFTCASFYSLGYIFLVRTPEYWCKVPEMATSALNLTQGALMNLTTGQDGLMNLTIPWNQGPDVQRGLDQCYTYNRNYSSLTAEHLVYGTNQNLTKTPCQEWEFSTSDVTSSLVTQWDLVCDRKWMAKTVGSVYLFGILAGSAFTGQISDRMGRRKVMLVCGVLIQVCGVASAFVTDYVLYLVFRFFVAMFEHSCYQVAFVLGLEIVGPSYRPMVGSVLILGWAVGYLLITLIGYMVRDLLLLQLCITIPGNIILLYFCLMPESPRWLVQKGRQQEAFAILQKMAKWNRRPIPEVIELTVKVKKQSSNPLLLLKTANLRRATLSMAYIWFACSFAYFGLSYNTTDLGGNMYVNAALSAVVEIPSCLIVMPMFKKLGRPLSCFLTLFFGSLALICTAMVPADMTGVIVGLAIFGKFAAASAFVMVWIYTPEWYPTLLRATSVSACSVCARLGGILGSYVFLLSDYHRAVPLVVIGLVGLLSSFLSLIVLPDTNNKPLPETMDQADRMCDSIGIKSKLPCYTVHSEEDRLEVKCEYTDVPTETDQSAM